MRQMLADETGSPELADSRLAEHLGINDQPEALAEQIDRFWNKVEANLRDGNVRLLFVADELPRELKRLVEFLNEQFTKIEVLGVELRQYVGEGIKALVPRVIGQTEAAREQKERSSPSARSGAPSTPTNRETFLASCLADSSAFFAKVLDEAANRGLQISWGRKGFSVRRKGQPAFLFCFPPGANMRGTSDLEFYLRDLPEQDAKELRSQLSSIPAATAAGSHTFRIAVNSETQPSAQKAFDIALQLMMRQSKSQVP